MRRLLQARLADIEHALPADPDTADELLGLVATLQVYLGEARRSAELNAQRWALLKARLGPDHARSTGAGMALAWALQAGERLPEFAAVLGELDGQLPAAGLLRAEWWLARHTLLEGRGAAATERGLVLQQALALYARDAPLDSGHLAAQRALGQLELARGRPAEALARFDAALAHQSQAQPYIASDHARLLLQRGRALRLLGRGEEALREEAAARALLAGSLGLDNPQVRRLLDEHAAQ